MNLNLQSKKQHGLAGEFLGKNILSKIETGTWGTGYALPSTAEIAVEYGVSLVTAHKELKKLVNSGHLVRCAGRGTFVAEKHIMHSKEKLGLPVYMLPNPYHLQLIQEISNQSVNMGWELYLGQGEEEEEFIERLAKEDIRFMLRTLRELDREPAIRKLLLKKQIKTVMINNFWFDSNEFPNIRTNLEPAIADSVDLLVNNGHRNIAFVDESNIYPRVLDAAAFYSRMIFHGIPCNRERTKLIMDYNGYDEFEPLWRELIDKFTAAVFTYDFYALMFMDFLKKNSMTHGKDFSIIGIDDTDKAAIMGLTSVKHPIAALVKKSLEILRDQTLYKPSVFTIDAELIKRESVGAIVSH